MDFELIIDDADKVTWDEWIAVQHQDFETVRNVVSRFMVKNEQVVPEAEARSILGKLPTSKMNAVCVQFTEVLRGMASNPKNDNN